MPDPAPILRDGETPQQLVERWFRFRGWKSFRYQRQVWNAYLRGESGLIHASTGMGKTYAAWLGPIIEWLAESGPVGNTSTRPSKFNGRVSNPSLRVLWITPLRALAADTQCAMQRPLDDLEIPWSLEQRTGDTPTAVRNRQRQRLPTALITTPESLSILLSRPGIREQFAALRLVVMDEWHELLGTKRGVQAELGLARLRRWQPELRVWGLSATLGNLSTAMRTLLGDAAIRRVVAPQAAVCKTEESAPTMSGRLVAGGPRKRYVIDTLIPDEVERFPWAGHLGTRMVPQVASTLETANSALVFTNTRSQAEHWYRALLAARPNWAGRMAVHHGSLDQDARQWVEQALRQGNLRSVVCTSSLDLGVDFQPVDRVLQIGSPKGIARLLQRAGRSEHRPGTSSRVTCVPTHAFELVEIAAARDALQNGRLEARCPVAEPLDLLAQHIMTIAAGGGFRSDELLEEVRTTAAFEHLSQEDWDWVLQFVAHGGAVLQAYPQYRRLTCDDGIFHVASRELTRRHRLSIGTITSDASLVVQFLRGGRIGTIEESFVSKLQPGDVFVFGGRVVELVRVRDMKVWVRRSSRKSGVVPRWMGGRMPLSSELSAAVRDKIEAAGRGSYRGREMQAVRPVLELQQQWSHLPSADELLVEQVKTREGHHLFMYPFEGRLVHEGIATLLAYRLSSRAPISFSMTVNDYGLELLSPDYVSLEAGIEQGLFSAEGLLDDIQAGLNSVEMARRQFREIARVAGLVFTGYPGSGMTVRQLQASTGLLYDTFRTYDPENLLLRQAEREVLERQLEKSRLQRAFMRLNRSRTVVVSPPRPTPLAFPLIVDRLRERLSSEKLADRVRRMQLSLEKAFR
jgi:ATP-dependent Lhr-like helicase